MPAEQLLALRDRSPCRIVMPEICKKHNLVLASDGHCVLCRRTVSEHARRRFGVQENLSFGERALTFALGVGFVAALGAVYVLSHEEHHMAPFAARALEAIRHRSVARVAKNAAARALPDAGGPLAPSGGLTDEVNFPVVATAITSVQPGAATSSSMSSRLDAARRDVSIDMYATSWCYVCDWAREDLARRGLLHRELDPDRDPAIAKRLAQINRLESLPTFEIDGETLVGYGTSTLNEAIERAALRRAEKMQKASVTTSTAAATPLVTPQSQH